MRGGGKRNGGRRRREKKEGGREGWGMGNGNGEPEEGGEGRRLQKLPLLPGIDSQAQLPPCKHKGQGAAGEREEGPERSLIWQTPTHTVPTQCHFPMYTGGSLMLCCGLELEAHYLVVPPSLTAGDGEP